MLTFMYVSVCAVGSVHHCVCVCISWPNTQLMDGKYLHTLGTLKKKSCSVVPEMGSFSTCFLWLLSLLRRQLCFKSVVLTEVKRITDVCSFPKHFT